MDKGGIQLPNYTEKYNLEKRIEVEKYDVKVQNANMDKIDTALDALQNEVTAQKDNNVASTL